MIFGDIFFGCIYENGVDENFTLFATTESEVNAFYLQKLFFLYKNVFTARILHCLSFVSLKTE